MAVKLRNSNGCPHRESFSLEVLNMTPLIDVVFQLLLFFLVATRFAAEDRELDVMLPAASEAKPLMAQPRSCSSTSIIKASTSFKARSSAATRWCASCGNGRRQSGQPVRDHPRRQTGATGPRSLRDERLQPGRHFRLHAHHGGRGELAPNGFRENRVRYEILPSGSWMPPAARVTSGHSYTRLTSTDPLTRPPGTAKPSGAGRAGNCCVLEPRT